jgi:hypothetical protein
MKKFNFSEGVREPLNFLEDLPKFHLVWQRFGDQGLD